MDKYGTWAAYTGNEAIILALVLFAITGILIYVAIKIRKPIAIKSATKLLFILLVVIWILSYANLSIAVLTYMKALVQQVGRVQITENPISTITTTSAIITFIIVAFISRHEGLKVALGSALIGTMVAPMIFELPFDIIVMFKTYTPLPAMQYTFLYFLPLFLWEMSTFSLLTLTPIAHVSKTTIYFLAAMFFVFGIWALFGFSYPFSPVPFALNAVSKILSFITAITLFLPQKRITTKENGSE
jgi:hypothetical protein